MYRRGLFEPTSGGGHALTIRVDRPTLCTTTTFYLVSTDSGSYFAVRGLLTRPSRHVLWLPAAANRVRLRAADRTRPAPATGWDPPQGTRYIARPPGKWELAPSSDRPSASLASRRTPRRGLVPSSKRMGSNVVYGGRQPPRTITSVPGIWPRLRPHGPVMGLPDRPIPGRGCRRGSNWGGRCAPPSYHLCRSTLRHHVRLTRAGSRCAAAASRDLHPRPRPAESRLARREAPPRRSGGRHGLRGLHPGTDHLNQLLVAPRGVGGRIQSPAGGGRDVGLELQPSWGLSPGVVAHP